MSIVLNMDSNAYFFHQSGWSSYKIMIEQIHLHITPIWHFRNLYRQLTINLNVKLWSLFSFIKTLWNYEEHEYQRNRYFLLVFINVDNINNNYWCHGGNDAAAIYKCSWPYYFSCFCDLIVIGCFKGNFETKLI